ncbi:MAG TPA: sterol desaturase family protein [Candidatus Binatus sp.]|nr:sterol desaturase family protein [Candidatus Binatus sp.]
MEKSILLTAIALIAATERVPSLRLERVPVLRPFLLTDLVYLVTGATGLGLLMRTLAARWSAAPGFASGGVPFPVLLLLATVLYDLGGYASHLVLHRLDVLWRIHKVHHSSRRLDWLAAFRGHVVEHALRHLASPVALTLLGFPPAVVGAAAAIYGAWAALGHANLRVDLAFLEPVFVTPRLHRLHHVPRTSAANLGTIFTFWDRLRGTLVTDPAPPTPLGVPGEEETYPQQWLPQLVEPLRTDR